MIRLLRPFGWLAAFAAVAWSTGPAGIVIGSAAFLAGWALGHRTGRHDAEREQMRAMQRYGPQGRYWITDKEEDALR